MRTQQPATRFLFCLRLIRLIGVIVPRRLRADWKQEWESELSHRDAQLSEWDRLDWRAKFDLLRRSASAFWDALWLQTYRWEDAMIQDLRFGVRMLLKSKGFAMAALLSLAVGIGINTAVFSLIDNLFLRELNVTDPSTLVSVHTPRSNGGLESWFPRPVFEQLRDHNQSFSAVLGWVASNMTVSANGEPPDFVRVGFYGRDYYPELGVGARLGRTFITDDDRVDKDPVAVISYRYWQSKFSSSESALNQTIEINGIPVRIIGVTPPGFVGLLLPALNPGNLAAKDNAQDIAVPMACYSRFNRDQAPSSLNIVARLKPGVTIEQARAEVGVLYSRVMPDALDPGMPVAERREILSQPIVLRYAAKGDPFRWESYKLRVGILMGVVAIVLLIACANITCLLLARAAARQKEIAIRLAIGAGRTRLIRQLLIESLLLAILGGSLGLWFAALTQEALGRLLQLGEGPALDWRVLGFAAGVSVCTAVLIGSIPALRATKVDLMQCLKHRVGATSSLSSPNKFELGKALVIFQVAVSVVLMIGAGLLLRSLQNLNRVELGFDPHNVLLFWIYPGSNQNKSADSTRLYEDFLRRFNQVPGVTQATMSRHNLMQGAENFSRVLVKAELGVQQTHTQAAINTVAPGFFATMLIPVLSGRDFSPDDKAHAPKVAIINQQFAKDHFGSESPLGRRIVLDSNNRGNEDLEIVGVVGNTRHYGLQQESARFEEEIFIPFIQASADRVGQMCFALRTTSNPMNVLDAVRIETQIVDKTLPVVSPTTQIDVIRDSVREERSVAILTSIFGAIAVLLACLGLYGVTSYSVACRTNEIGIRLALGAQAHDLFRFVIAQALRLTLVGVGIGLLGAFATTRIVKSLLHGVSTTDPLTFAAIAVLLVIVALVACYLPARRATMVDPLIAIRHE
jgi:predicted permease